MTNWKALAAAADPPVPEDLLPEVIPALEKLEAAFRALERAIPPETLLWNGPEDASVTISEIGAALRSKKFSVRELTEETLRRVADGESAPERVHHHYRSGGAGARGGVGRRARARHRPRTAARHSDRAQGQHFHPRRADHRRIENLRRLRAGLRRGHREPVERRGRHHDRQDRAARVCLRHHLEQSALRRDSESVGHGADSGRIERRVGCGGGGADSFLLATGTDTGGSIRIPASFCGVVGLKPTYERVSRRGVMPLGLTLDHAGLLARTVRDVALGVQSDREACQRLRACRARRLLRWDAHRSARELFRGEHRSGSDAVVPRGRADSGGAGGARDRDPAARCRGAQRRRTHCAAFGSVIAVGALSRPARAKSGATSWCWSSKAG